jgi:hypothetical protein
MYTKIDEKYNEIHLELDRIDKHIETRSSYWKESLRARMELKVGCVLNEQLHQDEVKAFEFNQARDELVRSKELFHLFDSQPFISLSNIENNEVDLNAPHLLYQKIIVDGSNWMENVSMENIVETMEYSDQQQINIEESTNYTRSTGNYGQFHSRKVFYFSFE